MARDPAATVVIVEPAYLPLWLSIRGQLPDLAHLIVPDTAEPAAGVLALETVVRAAEEALGQGVARPTARLPR